MNIIIIVCLNAEQTSIDSYFGKAGNAYVVVKLVTIVLWLKW